MAKAQQPSTPERRYAHVAGVRYPSGSKNTKPSAVLDLGNEIPPARMFGDVLAPKKRKWNFRAVGYKAPTATKSRKMRRYSKAEFRRRIRAVMATFLCRRGRVAEFAEYVKSRSNK